MDGERIPDGYLELCSLDALESLVLARMNRSAILYTQMKQLLQRWVESEADVRIARWMLEKRRAQSLRAGSPARELVEHAVLAPVDKAIFAAQSRATIFPALTSSNHSRSRRMALPVRTPRCAVVESDKSASGVYAPVQNAAEVYAAIVPALTAETFGQPFLPIHCKNRGSSADPLCAATVSQGSRAKFDQISAIGFPARRKRSHDSLATQAAGVLPLSARCGSPHLPQPSRGRMARPLARELTKRLKLGEAPGVMRAENCDPTDSSVEQMYLAPRRLRSAS